MKIVFHLCWANSKKTAKAFKVSANWDLLQEYVSRVSKFFPCEVEAAQADVGVLAADPSVCLWICERLKGSKVLSSEDVASELKGVLNSGRKQLSILIGGPDGFDAEDLQRCAPDLLWSFGPMTLPHELAAVVSSEQLYRAFTILNNHPYHCGH